MSQSGQEVHQLLNQLRFGEPAETPEEVQERLNIIEQILAALDPTDDYQAAILGVLGELNEAVRNIDDGRVSIDTKNLPVGLQGQAVVSIPNGSTGIATFDFAGGRYAALIEADEQIDQFENVRIKGEGNLATPIPTEESGGGGGSGSAQPRNIVQIYDKSVGSGVDILTNDVRQGGAGSSFRVSIQLDTTTLFAARAKPDAPDVSDFNQQFNQGVAIGAEELFEFVFDPAETAQYNFRTPNDSVTVRYLRVQELLESQ